MHGVSVPYLTQTGVAPYAQGVIPPQCAYSQQGLVPMPHRLACASIISLLRRKLVILRGV